MDVETPVGSNQKHEIRSWFNRIDTFVFHVSLLAYFQALVMSGYMSGINTTIERRYQMTSREIGIIYMSYELACIPGSIIFGILGNKLNRPRTIGIFSLLIVAGLFMFSLPHFFLSRYELKICSANSYQFICHEHINKSTIELHNISQSIETECKKVNVDNSALCIFCFSMALLGAGSSPLYVLAPAFLWDNLSVKTYSIYSAIFYTSAGIGPPFGFLMGGLFLGIYIDFPSSPICNGFDTSHSLWLGAWWIGMILIGCLMLVALLPLFKFKKVPTVKKNHQISPETDMSILGDKVIPNPVVIYDTFTNVNNHSKSLKNRVKVAINKHAESIHSLRSLFKNPIWIQISLLSVVEQSIVMGTIAYLSKYIQIVFNVPANQASYVVGGMIVTGAVVGLIIGGLLIHKLQPSFLNANKTIMILIVLTAGLITIVMLLRCQENYYLEDVNDVDELDGMNVVDKENRKPTSHHPHYKSHIINNCNEHCLCRLDKYEPLCDIQHYKNYYSPCIAGCRNTINNNSLQLYSEYYNITNSYSKINNSLFSNSLIYGDCRCALSPILIAGRCPSYCITYFIALTLVVFQIFFTTVGYVPINIMTLSSVPENNSSIALGMQMFLIHILAFIPVPLIFGTLFDYSCVLWVKDACNKGSVCNEYNVNTLPFMWLGTILSMKGLSFIFCFSTYLLARSNPYLKLSMRKCRNTIIIINDSERSYNQTSCDNKMNCSKNSL